MHRLPHPTIERLRQKDWKVLETGPLILPNEYFSFINLSGLKLYDAHLSGSDFLHARLDEIDLKRTVLSSANLVGASLKRAQLVDVNLSLANLQGALLTEASLIRVDLCGANLTGADLIKTTFKQTLYNRFTLWPEKFDPQIKGLIMVERDQKDFFALQRGF